MRLVDAIHQMIDRQLYLVVAPAGYGKTTLLVDFASDSEIPVCWYSLSRSDAEPAVFLDYLVAAIQARFPRFGADTRRVMAQADFRTDSMSVLATLVNEVQERIPDYFAVILDDYHEVNDSPAVNQLVDALLKHAPENFKLILSSRTVPKIELSRLAALRQAAGVGQHDLRFTTDEVRELMREAYQTVLPDRVVEELTARSEGWITGIILTTHTMWQGLFESMIRKSGQEQLYSYLANEVFERQAPAVQRFLLASSVLEDLDPSVAGPLAGVARADHILRRLQDDNLFVSELEGRKRVYRYHHLFRDFLRSRLDQGALGLSRPELERQAGLQYQQRSEHERAIDHLLAASAYEQAAESILAVAEEAFNRGRLETLARWIDALPEELRVASPRLALWRAQVAIQKGHLQDAVAICEQVELRVASAEAGKLAAEAKVHRAAAERLLGRSEFALSLCGEALEVFGDEASRRRALALRTVGTALWRSGSLDEARRAYERSHAIYEQLDDVASSAYLQNDLGVIAMFDGRLGQARQYLARAADLMEEIGNAGRWGLALSNLGVVTYLEDDPSEAIRLLEQAREKGEASLFPHTVVVATSSLADVYRDLGQYEDAERYYDDALAVAERLVDRGELLDVLCWKAEAYRLQRLYSKAQVLLRRIEAQASGYVQAQGRMVAGICCLEQGRFRKAARLFEAARTTFTSGGHRYFVARTLFHEAMLEYQSGNIGAGDERLSESLAIVEELGYSHFLTVDVPRWQEAVEQAAARGVGEAFLTQILGRLGGPSAALRSRRGKAPEADRLTELRVRTFGRVEVTLNGHSIASRAWGSHAARELLFYLLLHREGATKDRLMEIVAPETSTARANSRFHVAAYRLRRALYHGCLRYSGDYYELDPELRIDCDMLSFRVALAEAERAEPGTQHELDALQEAVSLYGGRLLEDFYADWVLAEQRNAEDGFLHAASRLAVAYLERNDLQAAISAAQRGLSADNSLEELHEVILRALLRQDRRSDAARHLESYAAYLRDELGAQVPLRVQSLFETEAFPRPRLLASR